MSGVERDDGSVIPRMKVSETIEKITNPGSKWVYRFLDKASGKAIADLIALDGEEIDPNEPYELFDPEATWKRQTVENYELMPLLQPIFRKGELVYENPDIEEMRSYSTRQMATLWPSVTRLDSPHDYYVDLSQTLWDLKNSILQKVH